jgi:hypothetical protein
MMGVRAIVEQRCDLEGVMVMVVTMKVSRYLHLRIMNGKGRWWRFALVCILCISFAVVVALLIENR